LSRTISMNKFLIFLFTALGSFLIGTPVLAYTQFQQTYSLADLSYNTNLLILGGTCTGGSANKQEITAEYSGTINSLQVTMDLGVTTSSDYVAWVYNRSTVDDVQFDFEKTVGSIITFSTTSPVAVTAGDHLEIQIRKITGFGSNCTVWGLTPSTTYKVTGDFDKAGEASSPTSVINPSFNYDMWVKLNYEVSTAGNYVEFVCKPDTTKDFYNWQIDVSKNSNFTSSTGVYVTWGFGSDDYFAIDYFPLSWSYTNFQQLYAAEILVAKADAIATSSVVYARAELWEGNTKIASSTLEWEFGVTGEPRVTHQCSTSTDEIRQVMGSLLNYSSSTPVDIYTICDNAVFSGEEVSYFTNRLCRMAQDLKHRAPFGYIYQYGTPFLTLTNTPDTSSTLYYISGMTFFVELRSILQIALWIVFGLYVVKRIKSLQV